MGCGNLIAVTLNGTRFRAVQDVEPNVYKGGKVIEESVELGDGSSEPVYKIRPANISGLQIMLDEENKEQFDSVKALNQMPIVVECVNKTYELTGYIEGEITISATKRTSGDFTVKVKDGSGIRES